MSGGGRSSEDYSNTAGVDQGLATPQEEAMIKTELHQNMRSLPENTSPFTGEMEGDVTDDSALDPVPA